MSGQPGPPFIRWTADQTYLEVAPGVQSDDFKYTGVLDLNASTTVVALNGQGQFGTKTLPASFGDVVGPAGATANAVARYDGVTGKLIKNSVVTIGDTGAMAGILTLNGGSVPTGTNSGDVTLTAVGAAPNADAASLTGQALTLQPASAAFPGVVTTGTQTIAGTKFIQDGIQLSAVQDVGDSNTLSAFETSFGRPGLTQTYTGPFAVSPIGPTIWGWDLIGSRCFIEINTTTGAAGGVAGIIASSSALPVFMRPLAYDKAMLTTVVVAGVTQVGTVVVRQTGIVEWGVGYIADTLIWAAGNNFPNVGGNNGFLATSIVYSR